MATVFRNTRKEGRGSNDAAATDDTALSQVETFETFSCSVPITNPDTPDLITQKTLPGGIALKEFERKFFNGKLEMPDGSDIEIWAFEDTKQPDSELRFQFPSAPIVVNESDLVHTVFKSSKNSHTIHHHGIEPTPMNDGVGHTSFEVTGSYTYQWRAAEAGTFFYHCHKNTTLHVEMGMYGVVLVLPQDHLRADGRFNAFPPMREDVPIPPEILLNTSFQTRDALRAYDVEAVWAADEMDSLWHTFDHNAGLCGENAGLNNFNPEHFLISGVPYYQQGENKGSPFAPHPRNRELVDVTARLGQTVLLRVVHAGYTALAIDIPQSLEMVAIEDTGRQLGGQRSPYSAPYRLPLDPASVAPVSLSPARRLSFLIRANQTGRYAFKFNFLHWISGKPLGTAIPTITFE